MAKNVKNVGTPPISDSLHQSTNISTARKLTQDLVNGRCGRGGSYFFYFKGNDDTLYL